MAQYSDDIMLTGSGTQLKWKYSKYSSKKHGYQGMGEKLKKNLSEDDTYANVHDYSL